MTQIKPAILLFLAFTLICGGIYPALVTAISQALFPEQAAGSFIRDRNGREIGSNLIGQPFSEAQYFWPRPSATSVFSHNPAASGGSNSGPTNPAYLTTVAERVTKLRESGVRGVIPSDLVQASASGLDPHISPESAMLQLPRVARARGIGEERLRELVSSRIEDRQFGFLGAPRVNVLLLNLELDRLVRR